MAVKAGFVDRVFGQEEFAGGAVRIMAIGTNHFSFPDRVSGTQKTLRFLFRMAGKAHFCLRGSVHDRIVIGMHGMTGSAG